ncbi:MAG: undecaprenyl-diphosphate phosphatase [Myxococcota bacterium]
MSILDIILLGIIEGLTELLPVSSTGHLILVGRALGHEGPAADALDVVIQLGAVAAVAGYFRGRIRDTFSGLHRGGDDRRRSSRLIFALLAAFVPTAIVGLLLHGWVKQHLFAPRPVAIALAVGGVVMLFTEWRQKRRDPKTLVDDIDHVDLRRGFLIGLFQCLALWPGASRSMTTIVGGQVVGLTTRAAAEFSFLLALPTLGAATVYDFLKHGHEILALPQGGWLLAVGLAVSFAVTWLVVAVFLRYVQRVGLAPFAFYRIALAAVVWVVLG